MIPGAGDGPSPPKILMKLPWTTRAKFDAAMSAAQDAQAMMGKALAMLEDAMSTTRRAMALADAASAENAQLRSQLESVADFRSVTPINRWLQ
jgi:hypothetical protein